MKVSKATPTEPGNKRRLDPGTAPRWMRATLCAAAAYNLLWGGAVIAAPNAGFELIGIEPPRYPMIWQCVGMIVGVYGVGYAIAATDPLRWWPITLVGLLGKVLGPIGFLVAALRGELPWAFGLTIVFNDLVWWVPFALILFSARRAARTPRRVLRKARLRDRMRQRLG